MTIPQMHHEKHYTWIRHAIFSESCSLPVEMCLRTSQSDSCPRILTHTLYSKSRSQRKDHVDCNTIFREGVSKLSSKCFHQNSVSDTRFEAEVPRPHMLPAVDIHVFWRSPWTGTKCITSSAASPSCLSILKSDDRETVNVAAKNVNTSQSDRWPIVSRCTQLFLCSRRSITAVKPWPMSVRWGVIYLVMSSQWFFLWL